MYASPHITFEEWQAGHQSDIDIFEDQLRTWLFEQARAISPNQHSGPAILALLSPYFEVIYSYLQGKSSNGSETTFLRKGLEEVFASVDAAAREAYVIEVRHGFAHEAMFRKVILHRTSPDLPSFGMVNGALVLDPWWILDKAEAYFNSYVENLRSNDQRVIPASKLSWLFARCGRNKRCHKPFRRRVAVRLVPHRLPPCFHTAIDRTNLKK